MYALVVLLQWLSSAVYGPVVNQLDSPDFLIRESAEARLRNGGLFALYALDQAKSPEALPRANKLRARYNHAYYEFMAWLCILGPAPPDTDWFESEHEIRTRVYFISYRIGATRAIEPEELIQLMPVPVDLIDQFNHGRDFPPSHYLIRRVRGYIYRWDWYHRGGGTREHHGG